MRIKNLAGTRLRICASVQQPVSHNRHLCGPTLLGPHCVSTCAAFGAPTNSEQKHLTYLPCGPVVEAAAAAVGAPALALGLRQHALDLVPRQLHNNEVESCICAHTSSCSEETGTRRVHLCCAYCSWLQYGDKKTDPKRTSFQDPVKQAHHAVLGDCLQCAQRRGGARKLAEHHALGRDQVRLAVLQVRPPPHLLLRMHTAR